MDRRRLNAKLGGAAVTNLIALMLVYALFGNSLLEAKVSVPAGVESKPTVQERILQVPLGTTIEVHLLNKQKLRGRLGEVTSDGFSLQTAQGNKVETQKIAFADVKSFKEVQGKKGGSKLPWILVGVAAGVALIIIALFAAAASNE